MSHSKLSYSKMHPLILHGTHSLTKLIIETEHVCLLHAGPTLLMSSLSHCYHIIGLHKTVQAVTRQYITCKCHSIKPTNQLLGQLPAERVTSGSVFAKVGMYYAGPFHIKIWTCQKAHCPQVLPLPICVSGHESCSPRTRIGPDHRGFHSSSPTIRSETWLSFATVEWLWN